MSERERDWENSELVKEPEGERGILYICLDRHENARGLTRYCRYKRARCTQRCRVYIDR